MTGRGYTPRRIYPHRRLRRYSRQGRLRRFGQSRLGRVIAFQALVCSILLFVAVLARVLNIGVAGYITEKVRYVLGHDMELKSIYAYAETLASDIRNSITGDGGGAGGDTAGSKDAADNDIRDGPADVLAGDPLSDNLDNTATLSAEISLPDTVDAASGVSGIFGGGTHAAGNDVLSRNRVSDGETAFNGTVTGEYDEDDDRTASDGGDARQQNVPGTGVLAASSGDIGDPAENADGRVKGTSSGPDGAPSVADKYGGPGMKHGDFNMAVPVEGKVVTPFGETKGAAGMLKMHNGIDIAVGKMSGIKAVLDGRVEDAGSSPGYGKFIKIRHSDSLVTVYANCSDIIAGIGEFAEKGDVIAVAGGERTAGGSHVHFEVWQDGVPADPLDYISIDYR